MPNKDNQNRDNNSNKENILRMLLIGDISASSGRDFVESCLPRLIEERQIDFTIANAENATNGFGLNRKSFEQLAACGVDAFTLGNHIWDNRDIFNIIDDKRIVRPANIHADCPGSDHRLFTVGANELVLLNLLGRVHMTPVDNPFAAADALIKRLAGPGRLIVVDFHAEITSEKVAMGWYLDGRASLMVGTHTHVQTNDARILPQGLGYITDLGMTGPRDAVLGVDKDIVISRFLGHVPERFVTAGGDVQFNGLICDLDRTSGKAVYLETLNFWQPGI